MQWERAIPLSLAEELKSFKFEQAHEGVICNAAADLAAGRSVASWGERLLELVRESHTKMRDSVSLSELNRWRAIYTDSCVLRAISQFKLGRILDAIATLDHALIIAGAYRRQHLVWDIICQMQSKLSRPSSLHYSEVRTVAQEITPSMRMQSTIPEISPPSFLSFQFEFSQKPFILRKYATDWPALQERPWKSAAYLRAVAGPGRVVPVEIGRDYRNNDWRQEIMDWERFLSTLDFEDQPATELQKDMFYLAQHDLTLQFPQLLEDIVVPDYVYSSLISQDFPAYRQPLNDKNMLFNSWLGPKGTLSPAHTDPYFNFFVQVVGVKSVWLAPPSASSSMYPISSSHPERLPQSSDKLHNTSQVEVFNDLLDMEAFPEYVRNVAPVSMRAVLTPGDVLFFPPGWWHAMRSDTTSFSFSIWF